MNNILILTILTLTLLIFSGCEQKSETKTDHKITTEQQAQKIPEVKEEYVATGAFFVGEQLYREEMQAACKISGYSLARKKSKTEWRALAESGKLAEAIQQICPELKYQNLWTPDIYEYLHRYAMPDKS